MTAEATEAQVAAAMEALGCARVDRTEHEPEAICAGPDHALVGGERPGELVIQFWTDRGCPVAVSVADAVVAAGPDPATIRRGCYCGCGWCCANNPPGVVPGDGHRNCSASKATP